MLVKASTIQLLRFPFSYFLMPVFWFALSFVDDINASRAILAFLVLHVLIYPASNGYNSYMDRDETSIGGIERPLQPTSQLFYTTIVLDAIAVAVSLFISSWFAIGVIIYIICSRLYSYRKIRLKKYPVLGYLTVILNQGSLTFFIVYHAAHEQLTTVVPWQPLVAAAFLIGGFYPITQVYQHEADKKDRVKTISMLLGKRGTFIFCAVMYMVAFGLLLSYYQSNEQGWKFLLLQIFFVPVIVFFIQWFLQVWKNERMADFKHTMQMNWIASTCTSMAFITLIITQQIG